MGKWRQSDGGRTAATLLSTTFVILIGLIFCAFGIVSFVDDPLPQLLVCAGLFVGFALFAAWLSRPADSGLNFSALLPRFLRRKQPTVNYQPRRRVRYVEFGTNAPPTVESVRDAAQHSGNNWVPHDRKA